MNRQQVRIGTRASKLAVTQSELVRAAIVGALGGDDAAAVLVRITTSGDRIQDRRLMDIGGKGLFTREIEEALLDGRIDCAVHSLKDMPAAAPPGLVIAAVPEREDPRDAFLSAGWADLASLPPGARLGTASLRRQAQSLFARPDLKVLPMRGNVDSRIAKLAAGEADAILLAMAGLKRLGLAGAARSLIDPVASPPAPGQGALAIQTRAADVGEAWLAPLRHGPTALAVAAERGALTALEGSCRTAVGAYARLEGARLLLVVEALTPDGSRRFRREGESETASGEGAARDLGIRLGLEIAREGGEALLVPA
ncbi:MAG: hydroxymethylbilane synthase [Caulobacteraceae bacterium]